ncbi:MAG: COX15/CtaA family protein, partial [Thermoleophilum sp.]|nr:COX15/CtaA family protein [Thermoleophilum sp.]
MSARAYRRLAVATLVATFLLIVLGGIVRVSGSGLGCGPEGSGFHGWPFCNGDIVPGFELTAVIVANPEKVGRDAGDLARLGRHFPQTGGEGVH